MGRPTDEPYGRGGRNPHMPVGNPGKRYLEAALGTTSKRWTDAWQARVAPGSTSSPMETSVTLESSGVTATIREQDLHGQAPGQAQTSTYVPNNII